MFVCNRVHCIFGSIRIYNKLSIENITEKEVMGKPNDSNEQNVTQHGWIFKRKDGSGLFVEKQGKVLICYG